MRRMRGSGRRAAGRRTGEYRHRWTGRAGQRTADGKVDGRPTSRGAGESGRRRSTLFSKRDSAAAGVICEDAPAAVITWDLPGAVSPEGARGHDVTRRGAEASRRILIVIMGSDVPRSWHVYASRFAAALDAALQGEAESKRPGVVVFARTLFLSLPLSRLPRRVSPCFKPTPGRNPSSRHRVSTVFRALARSARGPRCRIRHSARSAPPPLPVLPRPLLRRSVDEEAQNVLAELRGVHRPVYEAPPVRSILFYTFLSVSH